MESLNDPFTAIEIEEISAWPTHPAATWIGKLIAESEWGTLTIYKDASYRFEYVRPSDEQILKRWGHMLNLHDEDSLL